MARFFKHIVVIIVVFILVYVIFYALRLLPTSNDDIEIYSVDAPSIKEASGIAPSWANPGYYWVHNDRPLGNQIYLLNQNGKLAATLSLGGLVTRDVEDIAIGPGDATGESYIYLADIGDNDGNALVKFIYKIKEPHLGEENQFTLSLNDIEQIPVQYPDAPRDAEALMVDPVTNELLILSKREQRISVYSFHTGIKNTPIVTAKKVLRLDLSPVVAADISQDGSKILVKTYGGIYGWRRIPGERIGEALRRNPHRLFYFPEPQGEAACWSLDGNRYLTIPEELLGIPASLTIYQLTEPALQQQFTQRKNQFSE